MASVVSFCSVLNLQAQSLESFDNFGSALASGDFNGDGFVDLAIGARGETLEIAGVERAGAMHVLYGGSNDLEGDEDEFWHRDVPGILGVPGEEDFFGSSAVACDFNGDGYDDLVIGVSDDDIDGVQNAGSVNVIYGSADGLTSAGNQLFDQTNTYLSQLPHEYDLFGQALAAGYFDDNDYCDLAIGVPYEDLGSILNGGIVHVLYGASNGLSDNGSQRWRRTTTIADGQGNNDLFGYELETGDFNNDGLDDLAIGVPGYDIFWGASDVGAVVVIHGAAKLGLDGENDSHLILQSGGGNAGPQASDLLSRNTYPSGARSMAAGDFNGDDVDDLAVGAEAEGANGAVSVFYGTAGVGLAGGAMHYWDHITLGGGLVQPYDAGLGESLAAGDFDGDGVDDLAINNRQGAFPGGYQAGTVIVLYGLQPLGLTIIGAQMWHQEVEGLLWSENDTWLFGLTLASGDFDNNGVDDLAMGRHNDAVNGDRWNALVTAGSVNILYGMDLLFGGETGLGIEDNQFWHQGIKGVDGDGMSIPGVENTAGDPSIDQLKLDSQVKLEFSLSPVYPNPFSDKTTIELTLPETGSEVRLEVFDMTGKKVRTLIQNGLSAGSHTVGWDGRDEDGRKLATGVYSLRLQRGPQVATRMLTLLR